MGKSFDILQKMVIDHSEQSAWEESINEWDIIACSIDEKKKKRCIYREKITLKDFSGALLQFFYEKGVFKPTRYNQYNPENDYKFMVQMYHQVTDLTERQQSKVNALIINYIIPYIQTLENPS